MTNHMSAPELQEQSKFFIGYMDPEYAIRDHLTDMADIHSFCVVALEIAYVLQERKSLLELVDPDMCSEYSTEEVIVILNVTLLCT